MRNSTFIILCMLAVFGSMLALTGCLERSPSSSGGGDIDDDANTEDDDEGDDDLEEDDDWDDDGDDDGDDDNPENGCERLCDKMMECGMWYENDDPDDGNWDDPDHEGRHNNDDEDWDPDDEDWDDDDDEDWGNDEPWDECIVMCEESEDEFRECVMDNECNDIWECFDEEPPEEACHEYCWKMVECDEMDEREFDECLHECFEEPGEYIWCVLEVECEEIWECFDEEPFEEACVDYCWKLMECGELPPEEFSECFVECIEEPDDSIWCVLEVECDELDECFEDENWPESICEGFCEKHVDCGLIHEWEFDECMDWCWDEPFGYIVCVIENACWELDECWDEPPHDPDCPLFCDKLFECGVLPEDEFDQCLFECWEEPADYLWCVIEADCHEIEECIDDFPPFDPECPLYCDKLAECGWFVDESGQFNDDEYMLCLETCFDDIGEDEFWCVMEADCHEIEECIDDFPPFDPECPIYCEKLAECGWFIDDSGQFNDEEFMMCMESCFDFVDEDQFWCVMELECPEIEECFW